MNMGFLSEKIIGSLKIIKYNKVYYSPYFSLIHDFKKSNEQVV